MNEKPTEEPVTILSVKIPQSQMQHLKKTAQKDHTTVSHVVRGILRKNMGKK